MYVCGARVRGSILAVAVFFFSCADLPFLTSLIIHVANIIGPPSGMSFKPVIKNNVYTINGR